MGSRLIILLTISLVAPLAAAQSHIDKKDITEMGPAMVLGPRNMPLHEGAEALMAGKSEEGVRLTHQGLEIAHGRREEEAALSNLCAGYIKLGKYAEALRYCDILLARNDQNWRGYNNRAVIYIQTKQYEKAQRDLERGEALNPNARTMKIARSMYMDAVHPVRPEIEIDDRQNENDEENE